MILNEMYCASPLLFFVSTPVNITLFQNCKWQIGVVEFSAMYSTSPLYYWLARFPFHAFLLSFLHPASPRRTSLPCPLQ